MPVARRMRHNSDARQSVIRDDIRFECLIVFDVFQSDNDGFGGQSVPTASNHQIRAVGARS